MMFVDFPLRVEKQQKEECRKNWWFLVQDNSSNKENASISKTSSIPKSIPWILSKDNSKVGFIKQPYFSNTNSYQCFKYQRYKHIASKSPSCKIIILIEEESDKESEGDV